MKTTAEVRKERRFVWVNKRGSYVNIIKPYKHENDEGDGKYSIQIIVPKDDPQMVEFKKLCTRVLKQDFPTLGNEELKQLAIPWHDGDQERPGDSVYENMYYLNAKSSNKPKILNRQKTGIASHEDIEAFGFSGCYFHIAVDVATYSRAGNKGVNGYLRSIMLYESGESLGGAADPMDDFEAVEAKGGSDDDIEVDENLF